MLAGWAGRASLLMEHQFLALGLWVECFLLSKSSIRHARLFVCSRMLQPAKLMQLIVN